MDTSKLKRFAQQARRLLLDQVKAKLDLVLAQDSAARRENSSAVKELEEQMRIDKEARKRGEEEDAETLANIEEEEENNITTSHHNTTHQLNTRHGLSRRGGQKVVRLHPSHARRDRSKDEGPCQRAGPCYRPDRKLARDTSGKEARQHAHPVRSALGAFLDWKDRDGQGAG